MAGRRRKSGSKSKRRGKATSRVRTYKSKTGVWKLEKISSYIKPRRGRKGKKRRSAKRSAKRSGKRRSSRGRKSKRRRGRSKGRKRNLKKLPPLTVKSITLHGTKLLNHAAKAVAPVTHAVKRKTRDYKAEYQRRKAKKALGGLGGIKIF